MVRFSGFIQPDLNVSGMLAAWRDGDDKARTAILDDLENDHPGLAVFFVTEGVRRGILGEADCNVITNHLIEERRKHVA